jgi:hypothetical protein
MARLDQSCVSTSKKLREVKLYLHLFVAAMARSRISFLMVGSRRDLSEESGSSSHAFVEYL